MNLTYSQNLGEARRRGWGIAGSMVCLEQTQKCSKQPHAQQAPSNRESLVFYLKYGFVPEVDLRLKQGLSNGTNCATVGLMNGNQIGSFNFPTISWH